MHFWDQHKTITRYYEILMSSVCEKYQLKHLEYDILMFLHNNPQYRTAADIVRVRKSTKSHVSTSLKTLEDRGFIAKKTDPVNKSTLSLICWNRQMRSSGTDFWPSGSSRSRCSGA